MASIHIAVRLVWSINILQPGILFFLYLGQKALALLLMLEGTYLAQAPVAD